MRKALVPLLLAALLPTWLPESTAQANDDGVDAINAIAGNLSWRERFGHEPTTGEDAEERVRLETHLTWVEAELRARDVSHLSPELRVRRARLLDALALYTAKAAFPHNEHHEGRRPRFIDDEGRICAVGFLIEADRGVALAESIEERFEYDFLLDMEDERLASWVRESGFSARELAMVQPSYGFERPRPRPIEPPPPRPLTGPELHVSLISAESEVRECLEREGSRVRRVQVTVRHSVRSGLRVRARTIPTRRSVGRCVRAVIETHIVTLGRAAPTRPLLARRTYTMRPPTRPRAALVHAVRSTLDGQLANLQACMPPPTRRRRGFVTLRVRVDEQGQLSLIGARFPRRTALRGGLGAGGFNMSTEQMLACLSTQVSRLSTETTGMVRTIRHRIPYGGSRIAPGLRDLRSTVGGT